MGGQKSFLEGQSPVCPPVEPPLTPRDVNEARTLEAEAEARTLEAEAEAEARTLEAEAEAKARTLEARAEAKKFWPPKFNKF